VICEISLSRKWFLELTHELPCGYFGTWTRSSNQKSIISLNLFYSISDQILQRLPSVRSCLLSSATSPSLIGTYPPSKWRRPFAAHHEGWFARQESTSALASIGSIPYSFHEYTIPPKKSEQVSTNELVLLARKTRPDDPLKTATDAKVDIYNYAAMFLTVPRYGFHLGPSKSSKRYTSTYSSIELRELGIQVEGEGNGAMEAEIAASIRFQEAVKHYENTKGLTDGKDPSGLNDTNARVWSPSNILPFLLMFLFCAFRPDDTEASHESTRKF